MKALSERRNFRTAPNWLLLVSITILAISNVCSVAIAQRHPTRVVIITGEDSYAGHVWKDTSAELKTILQADKHFQVTVEPDPNFLATDALFNYQVAVFDFRNGNPLANDEKAKANLLKFLGEGKGLVTIHWADGAFPYWPEYINIVGRSQQAHHDPRGPFTVKIVDHDSPITRGMKDFQTDDELYYDFKEGNHPIHILAVAHSKVQDKDFPMAMTLEYGGGRVFNTPMGHDVKALQVPQVAELIRRGTAWAAGTLK